MGFLKKATMPPKPKDNSLIRGCNTRTARLFNSKPAGTFLYDILVNDGIFKQYPVDRNSSECLSSFPNTNWYSLPLTDGKVMYFQLMSSPDGSEFSVDPGSITNVKPGDIGNPCLVNPTSGRCIQPEKSKPEKAPKAPKAPKAKPNAGGAGAPGSDVGEDTLPLTDAELTMVERIQISAPDASVSGDKSVKITNEELAKMDKLQIIAWMVENMNPNDLMSCLRSGALTAQDKELLLDLDKQRSAAVRPSEVPSGGATREEAGAARAVMDLPGEQSIAMLKSLTKDQIIKNLKAIKTDDERQNAVVELCSKFNIKSKINSITKKISFLDIDNNPYSLEDALDFCATREAVRLKFELERVARETQTSRKVQGYLGGLRQRVAQRRSAPAPQAAGGYEIVAQLTGEINSIPDPAEKVKRLKQIFKNVPGYEKVAINKRTNKIMVYVGEDADNWESALEIYFSGGTQESAPVVLRKTPEQIIAEVNGLSGEGKVQMLTELFKNVEGFVKVGLNKRTNKVKVYIDDDVDDWEPLIRLYAAQLSGFGRRRRCKAVPKRSKRPYTTRKVRSNFKCAVKKCKGTRNYRKCMKSELRRIYRKKQTSRFCATRCKAVPKRSKRPYTTRKVRSNFKCAVKKCKGTSNYRKCMKTTLRKSDRKRCSSFGKKKKASSSQIGLFKIAANTCKGRGKGYRKCFRSTLKKLSRKTPKGRKSPKQSATLFKIGTVRKGLDGNRWVVKKTISGVKRWVKK